MIKEKAMETADALKRYTGLPLIFHVRYFTHHCVGNLDEGEEEWDSDPIIRGFTHFIDNIYLDTSGPKEDIRYFLVSSTREKGMLVPIRYQFSPYLSLRNSCETEKRHVEKISLGKETIVRFSETDGLSTYDGYRIVRGDGIHYTAKNRGSDDAPWGQRIGPILKRIGCEYSEEDHTIRGDLENLLEGLRPMWRVG